MKTKPILFSTPMVQAILEGRKTQTRRLVKPQPEKDVFVHGKIMFKDRLRTLNSILNEARFKVNDILWVRETFEPVPVETASVEDYEVSQVEIRYRYRADGVVRFKKWKPSIFMPKEACRLFLKVTNVRIERLTDISEDDAIAEGIKRVPRLPFIIRWKDYRKNSNEELEYPESSFQTLWDSINGDGAFDTNPWVWVYDFEQVRACRECGCTDDDCRQCIEKTGEPCHWVADNLCSACKNKP